MGNAVPPAHRNPGLDILRAVAVLLVLGRHLPTGWEGRSSVLDYWQRGGWVGVDLFFVLSGFLVGGLLFAEYRARGSIALGRFYVRRGLKIFPAFYFFTLLTGFLYFVIASVPPEPMQFVNELLFLQSYLPGIWNHTWSLAIEEHFYIALPLLFLVLMRLAPGASDPFRPLVPLVAVVAVVLIVLRWLEPELNFGTHLRIDSLLFGVLIGYGYHFHRESFIARLRPLRWPLFVAGVAMFVPAFVVELETSRWMYVFGLTLFYFAGGAVLIATVFTAIPTNAFTRFVAYLGSNSYSVYLWHMTVPVWVIPRVLKYTGPLPYGVVLVIYVVGSFALGVAMARLVEYPVLRLRDRWFPSRSRTPVVG